MTFFPPHFRYYTLNNIKCYDSLEVGKLAKQLSESATINPTQNDSIDFDKSP